VSSRAARRTSSNSPRPRPTPSPAPSFSFVGTVAKVTGGTLLAVVLVSSSIVAGSLIGLATSFRNLPEVRSMKGYVPTETSYIYDMKGKLLSSIHDEANRRVVSLDKISPHLKRALLAMEDSHFYEHNGINPAGIARAYLANIVTKRVVEGGSTVTMQLVKNLFLSPERAMSRKVAEAVLALRLEQVLDKNEILELYLNQVYWGHNTYGVETASQSYFGKSAADLTLAESAMMAGIVQAPEDYSPFDGNYKLSEKGIKIAKSRQKTVLARLRNVGWIDEPTYQAALAQKINFGKVTSFQRSKMPYVTEAVTEELAERFGREAVLKGGMRVQTTIDSKLQQIAEDNVQYGIQRVWSQGVYADQMALVAVDPRTHFVKAMVGGVNYKENQFNRAVNAKRQPGSAFKPFVFYAALATKKWAPGSTIMDTPVGYPDGDDMYYPRNYDNSFAGAISLRTALAMSRNIPAIRLGQEVGLDKVIEVCRILGIESSIEPVISLPLGSVDMTPLEMAGAYATFASGGWYSPTTFIAQVTDSRGRAILDNTPKPQLVLDPQATSELTSMMESVINGGTAKAAALGRPAAGKTGTTSSARDIWFVGSVPQLTTAIWVGNDNYEPMGSAASGGQVVAPLWRNFMADALQNVPVEDWPNP
jgi:penicillin-binding protein 1A